MVFFPLLHQTISIVTPAPANATYNTSFTVDATSSSGLPVSYSSSGLCTNSGATFTMTSGTGTATIIYDQAGNSNYNAATQVTESVRAQKTNQTISFAVIPTQTFGSPDFQVSASTNSGLPVTFSASGNATVSGNTVHITGAGSATITASQGGNSNYSAAAPIDQTFTINKAAATITFGSLSQTYDGSAKAATATTNPSGKTVVIAYSQGGNPVVSPTNAGSYDVSTTINDANYQGSTTGTLVVKAACFQQGFPSRSRRTR